MPETDILYSSESSIFTDVAAAAFSFALCQLVLTFVELKCLKDPFIDLYLPRKIFHITVGLNVMLCWPMFSSGRWGRVLGGLIPSLCFVRPLLLIFRKDDRIMKYLRKYRDSRDLLKAVLGYGLTIAFATGFHWRSPIGIATVCNLCAGDGVADIVGRRFGSWKLPYNKNKSFAGSISMAIAGFLASIIFMYYFSWFGYIQESPNMVLGFLMTSVASALVESHPLSTKLDDNLTVPVASILVGTFVL